MDSSEETATSTSSDALASSATLPLIEKPSSIKELLVLFDSSTKANRLDRALYYGTLILTGPSVLQGAEYLSVLESVFLGAAMYNQQGWYAWSFKKLEEIYPRGSSQRIQRLLGIGAESHGKWENALAFYKNLLAKAADDSICRKRIVSIYIAQKKYDLAIELLNSHLEDFSADVEAWEGLGEIYISQCSLDRALFCYEEMILYQEKELTTFLTCAELHASLGQLEYSRKYYCFCLVMDCECIRALWGLILLLCDPPPFNSQKGKSTSSRSSSQKMSHSSYTLSSTDTSLLKQSISRLESCYGSLLELRAI
ncbi:tetratricopeptide repeat-containing protein, partial [Cardiosporidium cionae]